MKRSRPKDPNDPNGPNHDADADALDAEPTPEELAAADALRRALEDPSSTNADADLLRSIGAAHAPKDLSPAEHRAIVARALIPKGRGGVVIRVAFGVSTVLAAAAAIALAIRSPDGGGRSTEPFLARSTQALFNEPFSATAGGSTARIDRIASVRGAEFRENQFARWGVK
jgi:hypothetical protein